MENININNNIDDSNDNYDLVELLYSYIKNWKWILTSIILALLIGSIFILVSPSEYNASASIYLKEESNSSNAAAGAFNLEGLGLLQSTNNLENEITILSSPDLMHNVVQALNLQTTYYTKNNLRQTEIYSEIPFKLVYTPNKDNFEAKSVNLEIEKNDSGYEVTGTFTKKTRKEEKIKYNFKNFPIKYDLPENYGSIYMEATDKPFTTDKYYVEVKDAYRTAISLTTSLVIIPAIKSSSVLKMSIKVHNKEKGVALLKELVDKYNKTSSDENNLMAQKTALFINDRIKEISQELGAVEQELVDYKQDNNITNLGAESQIFVEQTSDNEKRKADIAIQLSVISFVEDYIRNTPNSEPRVLPNLLVEDKGLALVIDEYNGKVLAYENILRGTNDDTPSKKRMIEDITSTRTSILSVIKGVRQANIIAKQNLEQRSNLISSKIKSVPNQEKGLLEKMRQQQIKESLFLFLMQKREENNISLASTADKARVVVAPNTKNIEKIAPKSNLILLISLLLGLIVPILIFYVRSKFSTQIENRRELEKQLIPSIVGEICKDDSNNKTVVLESAQSPISEMFRSLRNNLNFIFKHETHKMILVTSTISGEGKTFVSINLALIYALSGKKVLLVGADIRNPQLKAYLQLGDKLGLSDYLNDKEDNVKDYIIQSKEHKNIDVLTSGTLPPNPNELMMSNKMVNFIKMIKDQYDFVILDTAPVGIISDTYLIQEYADISLYVIREGYTPKQVIPFINAQHTEKKIENLYVVYNNVESGDYRYGYGGAYGYESAKTKR